MLSILWAKGVDAGEEYGKRIPALFIHKSGFLHLSSSISGNWNYYFNFNYVINKKYKYEIIQVADSSNVITFTVKVDGVVRFGPVVNTQPTLFEEAYLYVSEPYEPSHSAFGYAALTNLCVTNLHHF